ncbi:MAG: hypothetical protein GX218_04340 [Clostridiaceae bacterium]|jgi:hypothetical protein|nr:hypothetical protein [Clostridiaceae bacterium]
MITERENALLAINHQKPCWTPCFYDAYAPFGTSLLKDQGEPGKGGRDLFGSNWLVTRDTGFQTIHDPNEHILDDIESWRDVIKFPDLEAMDWAGAAIRDTAHVDRTQKLACCFSLTGSFNRLEALMGTCEALLAMYDNPDEVNHFFQAYTDFRVKIVDKYVTYYKPDIIVYGDDVASSDGLFFPPELYRKLVWPHEKRLHQAAVSKGVIAEHHVCGKVDEIIPDILATGATIWQTAQHLNDLVGIQKKYGDKLCIHGGWDSYGPAAQIAASEEDIRAEVRRCIDTYAEHGNYMLFPIIFGDPDDPRTELKKKWCSDECRKYKASIPVE